MAILMRFLDRYLPAKAPPAVQAPDVEAEVKRFAEELATPPPSDEVTKRQGKAGYSAVGLLMGLAAAAVAIAVCYSIAGCAEVQRFTPGIPTVGIDRATAYGDCVKVRVPFPQVPAHLTGLMCLDLLNSGDANSLGSDASVPSAD
jgi:hypothetical protein